MVRPQRRAPSWRPFLLFVFLLFLTSGGPAVAKVFDPEVFTLDNGLQVVVVTNRRAPIVTHMVWYKVGAADEAPGESGLAHFLEHLMFKGTETLGPGEFSRIVAENGGRENAFTSWDYTGYFQSVASDRLEIVMEHEADRIKNEIRSNLPKRMFLAVERRDMLEILDYQDSIADVAQDIAELADMRGMVVPEELASAFIDFVRRVVSACEQAERVINALEHLVETGFRGREVARVEAMIEELSRMETDTDELGERVQRLLFDIEDDLGISTIFWYKLIYYVGCMADYAERVGNRLRLFTAN